MPAMEAIVLDSTTPENRKNIYALEYWLVNMSFSIGSILGGILYLKHQFALFILLALINWSLAFCYIFLLKDDGQKQRAQYIRTCSRIYGIAIKLRFKIHALLS